MRDSDLLNEFTTYFEDYERCLDTVTVKGEENTLKVFRRSSSNQLYYEVTFVHGREQGAFDNIEDGIELAREVVADKLRTSSESELCNFNSMGCYVKDLKITKKR